MTRYISRTWLILLAVLVVSACATIDEPEQTGFLSDYSKLERDEDDRWLYSQSKTANYSKFHIEPIAVLMDPQGEAKFTPEEVEELKAHFMTKMTEALSENDGYEVVSGPGPGVASFRLAITEIDASIAALNVTIYTKATGAGLGGVAAEGEIIDSESGEQLAAAIRWGAGSRVLRAGLSKLGDAKIVIDAWAKDIRKRIDQAHGR
ncbi:MAG: DUF3313 domain-containing protein [Woeseiaceae bacterium]